MYLPMSFNVVSLPPISCNYTTPVAIRRPLRSTYMDGNKTHTTLVMRIILMSCDLEQVINFVSISKYDVYNQHALNVLGIDQLQFPILVSYGPMFKLESKVHVPVQRAVFTYGRLDTSDRSQVISRQASILVVMCHNSVCNAWCLMVHSLY